MAVDMIKLLISLCLTALCVTIHASGMTWSIRKLSLSDELDHPGILRPTLCLIRVAGWLILLHLFEIGLWAMLFWYGQAIPDFHSSFYFSSVTYTTVGYGDLVLPKEWRLTGGIEALTGILMCGWSTGFFFTVVTRMYQKRPNSFTSQ